MSDVPSEVVARGRAIFERLRGSAEDIAETPEQDDERAGDQVTDASDAEEAEPTSDVVEEPEAAREQDDERPADEVAGARDVTEAVPPSDVTEEPTVPADGFLPAPEPDVEPGAEPARPEEIPAPLDLRDPIAVVPDGATDFVSDETDHGVSVPGIEALEEVVPVVEAAPVPAPEPAPDATAAPDDRVADARRVVPAEVSSFVRDLPRVIAVANQKGGVGKTTTAVNLAACLADLGYRVLIVDLDPQGNASTGVGINIRDLATSMYDVLLHDTPLEDAIEATSVRNLYVAPANLELAGAEIELVPAFSRELKLRTAIETVRDDYDFVFIDCPPSLGLLTVNSMAAAAEVLVPIQCEYYALEGLGQLLRNVGLVQKNLNPTLEVSVIVCVMYDARTKLADQVVAEVRSHFGEKVCRTVVPRTVRLSEAPSYGQPISAFDPSSRGAIAYRELAKEVSGGTPNRAG